jgi:hypothetical protein
MHAMMLLVIAMFAIVVPLLGNPGTPGHRKARSSHSHKEIHADLSAWLRFSTSFPESPLII